MKIKHVFSNTAPKPVGPYSQATVVGGLMFISGLISIDPKTGNLALFDGDAPAQCKFILQTLQNFLHSQQLSLAHVAKTTLYLTNMDDFPLINEVYGTFFADAKPARACVEVSRLPKDVAIEIEAIVALD